MKEDIFYQDYKFTFCKSFVSEKEKIYEKGLDRLEIIDVKNDFKRIINDFDLVISLHCKQFFPVQLVRGVKCINIISSSSMGKLSKLIVILFLFYFVVIT